MQYSVVVAQRGGACCGHTAHHATTYCTYRHTSPSPRATIRRCARNLNLESKISRKFKKHLIPVSKIKKKYLCQKSEVNLAGGIPRCFGVVTREVLDFPGLRAARPGWVGRSFFVGAKSIHSGFYNLVKKMEFFLFFSILKMADFFPFYCIFSIFSILKFSEKKLEKF